MMYDPNFTFTNKIVNDIAEISSAREVIIGSYLVPSYDVLLRNNAILKASHSSTAIEGNPLTLKQVDELIKGERVLAAEKSKKEVLNYYYVLENIDKYHNNGKIAEKNILKLHKDITRGVLERPECEGKYRNGRVIVGNQEAGKINYVPPDSYKVPGLMEDFLEWINSDLIIYPVIIVGIAHYEFVRIHPFVNGNGRTARALATLILYIKEFDIKRYFALDEYYDADRDSYENALKSADTTRDLTQWLEYFVKGVLVSISKVKAEVITLSSERQRSETGQVSLSEQQIRIVKYLHDNDKIANKNIQKLFAISSQAALKIINLLYLLRYMRL